MRLRHWHGPTHEAIAAAAQTLLSPAAKGALAHILQNTTSLSEGALASSATWPDDIRARARFGTKADGWAPSDIAEADDFNAAHPTNASWHFVDRPLKASGYPASDPTGSDPMRPFVSENDIVHALRQTISILESPTATADFSKRQAVRWIVHLVGDLHQPMHVTSGYFNPALTSFKTKPARIGAPVKAGAAGVLKNGQTRPGTNGEPDSVIATIAASTKTAYLASQKSVAQAQIVTAAARLAALLRDCLGERDVPRHA